MTDKDVQKIIDELVKNYQPEKVILFGSRANGKTHEWSDIDLAVIKNTNKKFRDRIREASASFEHILPVDLLIYTPGEFEKMAKENSFIKEEVIKKGQTVYEQT